MPNFSLADALQINISLDWFTENYMQFLPLTWKEGLHANYANVLVHKIRKLSEQERSSEPENFMWKTSAIYISVAVAECLGESFNIALKA